MHQCKKHLLHELAALVNDAKVVFAGGDNVVGLQVTENSSADEAITEFPEVSEMVVIRIGRLERYNIITLY